MIFYLIAFGIVVTAILTIASRNSVVSALWLVACLFAQAILMVTLEAHLVAAMQVLLYAGAIMVLILFVIMLLNLTPKELKWKFIAGERLILGSGVIYLAGVMGLALWIIYKKGASFVPAAGGGTAGTVEAVGKLLLTKYALPFELVSVTLLVAIVGAILTGRGK
ncbi:MAG: NADH-quinone oxidoreductase subunit J [Deltaproteobacteria bacterium]|nr:NADH-quinone oxidoreductase subunit J [Deltaproteobacteria bacterium]MBI2342637.1 NADH-quinone oxidoreductase subunit J [Deltaproteobacteria bacterium]MBI2974055.1 NADH-quinone oxidoreductase subunit J [Deltaproteobacteria bacterium]